MARSLARPLARSLSRSLVIQQGGGEAPISEFITNGAFATDTNWTKGAGWTISSGTAQQSGLTGALSQNFGALVGTLTNGSDYVLSFSVVTGSGDGDISTVLGGSQALTTPPSSVGLKTIPFTASGAHGTLAISCPDGVVFSIDDVSLAPA